MKKSVLFISVMFAFAVCVSAQGPPPPVPAAEMEIREDSIKLRSKELELVRRRAIQPRKRNFTVRSEIKFSQIKKDFEKIQKLQDSIIKEYTTKRILDYSKISDAANGIKKRSLRLDENLFGVKENEPEEPEGQKEDPRSLKDLIIALDKAIGKFISNPIFRNIKIVDTAASNNAQTQLRKVMYLSQKLALTAEK